MNIGKLHSNLQTLQLVGGGVDFVFTLKKQEGRKNPHLAFNRRNDLTCVNFGDFLVGVWKLS